MPKKSVFDILLALFIFSLVFSGCFPGRHPASVTTPEPFNSSIDVRLRVTNAGSNDISNLTVLFPNSRIVFGDVPAGTTTAYHAAPTGVYNYAAYSYRIKGEQVTQPVVDWVGETPRPGKSFTYVIDYDPARPAMQQIRLVAVQPE